MQDVAQKFTLAADKKHLRIEVGFPEQLPLVHADIGLIERVFENLIENAMRYTAPGGVIRLSLSGCDAGVEVSIADTGQGMEPDEMTRIFDRYYRADRAEASDSGHAGLGLAIAHRIVTLHGSAMRVESQRGVGTTFSFDVPLAAGSTPAGSTPAGSTRAAPG
jgi:signal transduction histidine kinase